MTKTIQIPDLASIKRVFVVSAATPMLRGNWYYATQSPASDNMIRKIHALLTENAHAVRTVWVIGFAHAIVLDGTQYVLYRA